MATNLSQYYASQGQALPSVSARADLASKAGVTGTYTGTAAQNAQVLSYLQKTPTSSATGVNPVNTNTNINSKTLNTNATSPVTIPQTNTNTNTQNFINGVNAGVTTSLAQTQPLTPEQQETKNVETAQTETDTTTKEIQNLMKELGYKSEETQNLQNQYNIPGLTSQLSDLKTQYASKQAEFNNIIKATQGQNIPSVLAGGQGALQQAIAATALGGIAAQIQVAQGNLDAAEDTIKRTIDQKYGAIEDNINAKLKFYEINKDKLTAAQKVVADRKAGELEIQKYNLQVEKSQTTSAIADITAAAKSGQINASTGYKIASDLAQCKITAAQAYAKLGSNSISTGVGATSGVTYTPGTNPQVDAWVKNIQNKTATLSNVPANLKNAVSLALSQTTNQIAQNTGILDSLNLVNQLSQNPELGNITGLVGQYVGGLWGQAATAKNQYNQLVNSLSLENRSKLKGQGAVSDFEGKMLAAASTALNRNLDETEFRKQLAIIKGAFTTAAGGEADVTITDTKTGQSKTGKADRQVINDAIASGYLVNYN